MFVPGYDRRWGGDLIYVHLKRLAGLLMLSVCISLTCIDRVGPHVL